MVQISSTLRDLYFLKIVEFSHYNEYGVSTRLDQCVLMLGAKWILNYVDILDKCPVKSRISLTQAKVTSLDLGKFVLKDGEALKDSILALVSGISDDRHPTNVDVIPCEVSKNAFFCPSEISLQFILGHFGILGF